MIQEYEQGNLNFGTLLLAIPVIIKQSNSSYVGIKSLTLFVADWMSLSVRKSRVVGNYYTLVSSPIQFHM